MSKRRKRKSAPNLPKATLERARRQIAEDEVEEQDEVVEDEDGLETEPVDSTTVKAKPDRSETRREARRSRRSVRTEPAAAARRRDGELTNEQISELLMNPTVEVTEEELHEEYAYVVADLRSMGILAAVLMIVLVALAQFI